MVELEKEREEEGGTVRGAEREEEEEIERETGKEEEREEEVKARAEVEEVGAGVADRVCEEECTCGSRVGGCNALLSI